MYIDRGNFNSGYYSQYVPSKFSNFGTNKQNFVRYDLLFGIGKSKIIIPNFVNQNWVCRNCSLHNNDF